MPGTRLTSAQPRAGTSDEQQSERRIAELEAQVGALTAAVDVTVGVGMAALARVGNPWTETEPLSPFGLVADTARAALALVDCLRRYRAVEAIGPDEAYEVGGRGQLVEMMLDLAATIGLSLGTRPPFSRSELASMDVAAEVNRQLDDLTEECGEFLALSTS
jgi:hypothetical protein